MFLLSWFHLCFLYLEHGAWLGEKWILRSASFLALCISIFPSIVFWPFDFCDLHFEIKSHVAELKWSFMTCTLNLCFYFLTDHSYVVVQLDYLSMRTVCITTMHARICLDSCRPHFSLDTWPAYAMVSSWCLEQLDSVLHCSLFVTYTDPLSASRHFVCPLKSSRAYCLNFIGIL